MWIRTERMKLYTGKVYIKDMRFYARHGVLAQETSVGAEFRVSLEAEYPLEEAIDTDDVQTTLNYADVFAIVQEEMAIPSKLIEHVAGRIGQRLLKEMPKIRKLMVNIMKVNPPMEADCCGAGVQLYFIND